jgi:simple sugar transport system permease protein
MSELQNTTISQSAATPPQRLKLDSLIPRDSSILRLLIITLVVFAAFSLARPNTFPTSTNLEAMARQMSEIGILALAVALTMLSGGIDLSINATGNLTAITVATILTALTGAPDTDPATIPVAIALAIVAGLGVGLTCGTINGLLVAFAKIPPILATLGTMTLFTGIGTVITRGAAIFGQGRLSELGNGEIGPVPIPMLILLTAALVVSIILNRTKFGFDLYMVGTNPQAARFSGINNRSVLLRAYLFSGLLSAVAGIIVLGRIDAARVDFGESYVLLAIMICVLGGIDPAGGFGRVSGVVLAVIALQLLSTGLNQLLFENSGANFFRQFAWGATLLLVLMLNYFSQRQRLRRASAEK